PLLEGVDAVLLGRRTYASHAEAFEPDIAQDPFASCAKYVVSRTLEKSLWRNTTIIRDNPIEAIKQLKAGSGGPSATDGSSQLVHPRIEHDLVDEIHLLVFPLLLGSGKRVFPNTTTFRLKLTDTVPYPTGVVGLHYARA